MVYHETVKFFYIKINCQPNKETAYGMQEQIFSASICNREHVEYTEYIEYTKYKIIQITKNLDIKKIYILIKTNHGTE